MSLIKSETYTIHGRNLIAGQTQLSVKGITGRVVFYAHVRNPEGGEWLDVWKLPRGKKPGRWCSVAVDKVTTVHNAERW